MRIKSLELNGFKSFVDKTCVAFEPGVTAIVGPNGCGKSNIVDAIRWAMGEQSPRRLRGRGMEDVIFSGSDARTQVGMAEVVLSFDNTEGDGPPALSAYSRDRRSTRRLYRSGESEYLLNKTPCRLKDIHRLLPRHRHRHQGLHDRRAGTHRRDRVGQSPRIAGHSSKRRPVSANTRRVAARRSRRSSSTEQNLLRVTDVLSEIRRQISSIERQARKAAGFKRIRESLRLVELSLAVDDRQRADWPSIEARPRAVVPAR